MNINVIKCKMANCSKFFIVLLMFAICVSDLSDIYLTDIHMNSFSLENNHTINSSDSWNNKDMVCPIDENLNGNFCFAKSVICKIRINQKMSVLSLVFLYALMTGLAYVFHIIKKNILVFGVTETWSSHYIIGYIRSLDGRKNQNFFNEK